MNLFSKSTLYGKIPELAVKMTDKIFTEKPMKNTSLSNINYKYMILCDIFYISWRI